MLRVLNKLRERQRQLQEFELIDGERVMVADYNDLTPPPPSRSEEEGHLAATPEFVQSESLTTGVEEEPQVEAPRLDEQAQPNADTEARAESGIIETLDTPQAEDQ